MYYAILTSARTGGNWLCQMLSSIGLLGFPTEHDNDPDIIDSLRHLPATPNGVRGYKLCIHAWTDLWYMGGQYEPCMRDVQLVHLTRWDKLAQAISHARALTTGVWHRRAGDVTGPQVELDDLQIVLSARYFAYEQRMFAEWLQATGRTAHSVVYEELLQSPLEIVRELVRELGVAGDVSSVSSSFVVTRDEEENRRISERLTAKGLWPL